MNAGFGLIITAGEVSDYALHRAMLAELPPPRIIYCADGGLRHMGLLGLEPDLILGDFDSAGSVLIDEYRNRGAPFEKHPADKDYTDTELAVSRAVSGGICRLLIFGALGARIDHTYTNIQLIFKYAKRGVRAVLADAYGIAAALVPGATLKIIKDKPLASLLGLSDLLRYGPENAAAPPTASGLVFMHPKLSLLPIGGAARGVTVTGMKYALTGSDLEACYTSGVSNEFSGNAANAATVEIAEGALLVMVCADR